MLRYEAGPRRTGGADRCISTRSHWRTQGGMRALANVEDDNWEWHTSDTVKGDHLADQDAVEIMQVKPSTRCSTWRRWGCRSTAITDQCRFGGHTCDHGAPRVRRACHAADRTGHDLRRRCIRIRVKHDVVLQRVLRRFCL